jgi:hypothetical protein
VESLQAKVAPFDIHSTIVNPGSGLNAMIETNRHLSTSLALDCDSTQVMELSGIRTAWATETTGNKGVV